MKAANLTVEMPVEEDVLYSKFLGLSLVERRARELKKEGYDKITLWVTSDLYPLFEGALLEKTSLPVILKKAPAVHDVQEDSFVLNADELTPKVIFRKKEDVVFAEKQAAKDLVAQSKTGWVGKRINKKISIPISLLLIKTPITPNLFSIFNFFIGVLSAYMMTIPTYWGIASSGLLFQMCSILDGVDGEIAKFKLESSKLGAMMDSFSDNATLMMFIYACWMRFAKHSEFGETHMDIALWSSFVALIVLFSIMFYVSIRYFGSASLVTFDQEFIGKLPRSDVWVSLAQRLKSFVKKDFFSLALGSLCLFGRVDAILGLFLLGLFYFLLIVVVLVVRYGSLLPGLAQKRALAK